MNWSAGLVVGFGLALAIDAAARVQHTYKTRPAMKGISRSARVGGSGLALAIALGSGWLASSLEAIPSTAVQLFPRAGF